MIISDKYRYVFVELPLTGSSAISKELRRMYGGKRVLNKHSTYRMFLNQALPAQKQYFSFSCIRNPMDAIVSQYFKLKTDHFNFTAPDKMSKRNWINRLIYARRRLDQLQFIHEFDADFSTYFLTFFTRPYSNWAILSHHELDFVIRFEQLETDFKAALDRIGLPLARPLPVRNKTSGKEQDFLDYYPEDIRPRAKTVFQSFMSEWGYEFPNDWGEAQYKLLNRTWYHLLNVFRRIYWARLRFGR